MNNFLSKIKEKIGSIHNFFKINPHRHWAVLLYLFFSLTFLLILFSFYILYEIKNEQIFQVTSEQQNTKTLLREDLLKKTMDLYDIKAQKEINIINSPSQYKDPSL